jgi:uncharacterized protein YqgV (UPF0045/DUF77 family)
MTNDEHVLADVSIEPAAGGEAHGHLIEEAIAELRTGRVQLTVGALSTTLEGSLSDVLAAVARAHTRAGHTGERVITTLRLESKPGGLHLENRVSRQALITHP